MVLYASLGQGSYDSATAYLHDHRAPDKRSIWRIAAAKIIDVVAPNLPAADDFVLSVPDFDSQNIMVDEAGNLTGIIDCDLVQTLPRCVGYCRYPGWITRDWDPLMYGCPESQSENSPDELEAYRRLYHERLGEELQRAGDWHLTEKSHVREAVWIATLNCTNRLQICTKLVQAVAGDADADDILYGLGTDRLSEGDWGELKRKLANSASH